MDHLVNLAESVCETGEYVIEKAHIFEKIKFDQQILLNELKKFAECPDKVFNKQDKERIKEICMSLEFCVSESESLDSSLAAEFLTDKLSYLYSGMMKITKEEISSLVTDYEDFMLNQQDFSLPPFNQLEIEREFKKVPKELNNFMPANQMILALRKISKKITEINDNFSAQKKTELKKSIKEFTIRFIDPILSQLYTSQSKSLHM
jgi:hypothetical protein